MSIPRILVLDDLFGRSISGSTNADRENLCAHFLLEDGTGDGSAKASKQKVLQPTAEAVFCRAQSPTCSAPGDTVENDLEIALEAVRKGWPEAGLKRPGRPPKTPLPRWSMVLIDLCFYTGRVTEESHRRTLGMPEGRPGDDDPRSYFGLTLLDVIHRECPELPIFILSSKPRVEVSLEFSRRGALGFIDRSALDGPKLLEEALWNHGLLADPTGEVVGQSLPMLLALREARRAAAHRENVLVRGERGSGKESLAGYIHRAAQSEVVGRERSHALSAPLVTVNSAVFTPNLFASELFGIQPKTATGVDGKVGLIEMASGGDLFLDEIADMSPEVQAAMLRVLQERQITRVGGRETINVDVRFISATNRDLETLDRPFRADLLDRLRLGGTITLPPLRERREDIPVLVERFVREAESKRPGTRQREITPEALELLVGHDWPGNIRELRSVILDSVNRHPDIDHMVPAHLRIQPSSDGGKPIPSNALAGLDHNGTKPLIHDVSALLEGLARVRFDPVEVSGWAGKFDALQKGHAKLVARMLQAALDATKRRTPENPLGTIQIHPAAKLVTGNSSLTASKAADLLKRLLGPLEEELDGDLREAYRISVRLRPKSSGQRAWSNESPETPSS